MEAAWWWKWTITQSARSDGGGWKLYWQHAPMAVLASTEASSPLSMVLAGSLAHSSEERSCAQRTRAITRDQEHGATVWLLGNKHTWLICKPCPAVSLIQKYLVPEQTSLHGGWQTKIYGAGCPLLSLAIVHPLERLFTWCISHRCCISPHEKTKNQ